METEENISIFRKYILPIIIGVVSGLAVFGIVSLLTSKKTDENKDKPVVTPTPMVTSEPVVVDETPTPVPSTPKPTSVAKPTNTPKPVVTSEPGNSSTTNNQNYKMCSGSNCIGFASPNYYCENGKTISIDVYVRNSKGLDEVKKFTLSNKIVTVGKPLTYAGGDIAIHTYEVKCNNVGKTTMTVEGENGKSATGTLEVVDQVIPIKSISLNKSTASIVVGDSLQLKASFNPSNATNKNIRWYTSNSKVATVDKSGLVKSVGEGNARITAIAWNDDQIYYESHIDITSKLKDGSSYVSFNQSSYTCGKGKTIAVSATVCNDNVPATKISNQKIAKITQVMSYDQMSYCTTDKYCGNGSNGKSCNATLLSVKCLATGTTNLTIKTNSGKTDTVTIKVIDKFVSATGVSLGSLTFRNMLVGDSFNLSAEVTPSNATNKKVYWKSNNEKAIIVDQNGRMTAVGAGKATITAMVFNDDTKVVTDSIVFNSFKDASDIKVDDTIFFGRKEISCRVGTSSIVTVHTSSISGNPSGGGYTLKSIKSNNTKIATLTRSKYQTSCMGCYTYDVKCVKSGTTTIEAENDLGGKASLKVIVK